MNNSSKKSGPAAAAPPPDGFASAAGARRGTPAASPDFLPKLIAIIGPTASGKTGFAIQIAQENNGAIISADSRQVYAGMNIGTAKPKEAWSDKPHSLERPDTVEGIDHYLFNISEPTNQLSLAEWQAAAFNCIDKIIREGKTPLLVGGTMLYVDSVAYNYLLPRVEPNEKLRAELEQKTAEELYGELLKSDPDAEQFIEPGNKRRIIRALEVIKATDQPFSKLRKKRPPRYEVETIGIFPGWDKLRENVTTRAMQMMDEGLIEEVKTLQAEYGADLPLLQTMYYKQAGQIIANELSANEALDEIIKVTMRYAHRQMSWWKNHDDIKWIEN